MDPNRTVTVGERIVVHLFQYASQQDAYVCPPEMGQAGIAIALGISRAHAAIELKRQITAGRVDMRIAHVKGLPTRRKVYHLTPRGLSVARDVRRKALEHPAEVLLPDGGREVMAGERALRVLRRHGIGEGRAIMLLLARGLVEVRKLENAGVGPSRAKPSAERRAQRAFARTFQRPYEWHLAVVQGPPNAPPVPVAA